ncbi:MAG: hypothetical protein WED81_01155, partial [Rhodothermales bacterium]
EEPALKLQLIRTLQLCLTDSRGAWELRPDGHYVQRQPDDAEEATGVQEALMMRAKQRLSEVGTPWDIT